MKQRHQVFAQLTRALSRVYFDLERASGVAKDAGLAPAVIRHDPTPLNYWRNILDEAERQRAVEALLDVAEREYPKEERLPAARAAYQGWVAAGRPEAPLVEDIQGERIDAREARGFIYQPSAPVTQYFVTFPEQPEEPALQAHEEMVIGQPPSIVSSWLQPIPIVQDFMGREAELTFYRSRLQKERIAIITGMEGIGKTYLGAKLAREVADREEEIFWFNFGRSANNTSGALIWMLAAFLYCR